MNGQYKIGDTILGNWTLTRLLGEGSYGKVYEAERVDFGTTYKAAIKIVTIPQSQSEITNAKAEGMDDESVTTYFRGFVEELVQEFALMSRLKGTANVVSYEDHTVVEHTEGLGWDIIIRMELLTPLLDYTVDHPMTRRDVMQLGIDMCKALELCQRFNIVHRDIKPENIFVSELGDYKLGDFGIARTVEKTTGGLSKKGTYTYMAPEVYREEPYNSSVDIYSLGIVLYRLLNDNRAPFLPAYPAPIKHSDRDSALKRRLSGEAFLQPKNADGRLAEIVLKACAYKPEDRYSSPMLMRQELEAILYEQGEAAMIYPQGDETPLKSIRNIPTGGSDDASDETLGAFTSVPEDNDVVVQDKTVHEQNESTEGSLRLPVTGEAEDSDETIGAFSDIPDAKDAEETMGAYSTVPTVSNDIAACTPKPDYERIDGNNDVSPKKTKKTGLVIGIVAGVVAVLAAVIAIAIPKGGARDEPAQVEEAVSETIAEPVDEGFIAESDDSYLGIAVDYQGEPTVYSIGSDFILFNEGLGQYLGVNGDQLTAKDDIDESCWWIYEGTENEYWFVRNVEQSEYVLDIDNAIMVDGHEVKVWTETGYDVQSWGFYASEYGSDTYLLVSQNYENGTFCLGYDMSSGTFCIRPCDEADEYCLWSIINEIISKDDNNEASEVTYEKHYYADDTYSEYKYVNGKLDGATYYDEFGNHSDNVEIDFEAQEVVWAKTDTKEIYVTELGLLWQAKDANGYTYYYSYPEYDDSGNPYTTDSPPIHPNSREVYDENGDFAFGDKYEYNSEGNLIREVEYYDNPETPDGVETRYIYNDLGCYKIEHYFDGRLNYYVLIDYDDAGNAIKSTIYGYEDEVDSIQYSEYDDDGNEIMLSYTDDDGTITQTIYYEYDDRGNLIGMTYDP